MNMLRSLVPGEDLSLFPAESLTNHRTSQEETAGFLPTLLLWRDFGRVLEVWAALSTHALWARLLRSQIESEPREHPSRSRERLVGSRLQSFQVNFGIVERHSEIGCVKPTRSGGGGLACYQLATRTEGAFSLAGDLFPGLSLTWHLQDLHKVSPK